MVDICCSNVDQNQIVYTLYPTATILTPDSISPQEKNSKDMTKEKAIYAVWKTRKTSHLA